MNFLFLMDPLETVNCKKDTSFAFMLAAGERGHNIFYLPKGGIVFNQQRVEFNVVSVLPQRNSIQPFVIQERIRLSEADVDALFIRPDPPFDAEYLMHTWLLERLPRHIPVINHPAGVRTVNEKVWVTQFSDLIPRTVVTRSQQDYLAFLRAEGEIIAKPTDGHGGAAVFRVCLGDPNTNVIFEVLSQRGTREVIVQEYLPAAQKGDKRILLLNGELLGAVLRVHSAGDHRNNFFAGGQPVAATITARDHEIIARLKSPLQRLGLYFVGIDVIGEHLVEVNVTSPTGIQEASHFASEILETKVIAFVEQLAADSKPGERSY